MIRECFVVIVNRSSLIGQFGDGSVDRSVTQLIVGKNQAQHPIVTSSRLRARIVCKPVLFPIYFRSISDQPDQHEPILIRSAVAARTNGMRSGDIPERPDQ